MPTITFLLFTGGCAELPEAQDRPDPAARVPGPVRAPAQAHAPHGAGEPLPPAGRVAVQDDAVGGGHPRGRGEERQGLCPRPRGARGGHRAEVAAEGALLRGHEPGR